MPLSLSCLLRLKPYPIKVNHVKLETETLRLRTVHIQVIQYYMSLQATVLTVHTLQLQHFLAVKTKPTETV